MNYGSLCSGIEAASQAWHPLGWKPKFFSEIEAAPSAILAHHYPGVPNLGDMTKFEEWDDHAIDLLVGGTPCQDYSIAGGRLGMAGSRGQLSLTYIEIAARYRPRWAVWENVPGVLTTNSGRDFAKFLGDLAGVSVAVPAGGWKNAGIIPGIADAYGIAYRVLDAQYCRTRRFLGAVPQRRRRVFVVGYLGDWRRAAAVLLDPQGLRRDPPPRREAGQVVAGALSASSGRRGGVDDPERGNLVAFGGGNRSGSIEVGATLTTKNTRLDFELETFIAEVAGTLAAGGNTTGGNRQPGVTADTADSMLVAHTLRGEGFDASEDGSGRGTPIIPVSMRIAGDGDAWVEGDISAPLTTGTDPNSNALVFPWAVRRLTPLECTRLQGFPDDYFDGVRYRGKRLADGPIYKALGNSMAVNVMQILGERIEMVDSYGKH